MSMMNQRDAVFAAVCSVLGGVPQGQVELKGEQKKAVHEAVVVGFLTGQIELKGDRSPEWIAKYVPGLVNNWVRKDKRLNGNTEYVAKNPGSRSGAGDEMLKNLRALLAVNPDPKARKEIQSAIDKRMEELKPKLSIDINNLPEHLRQFAPVAVLNAQNVPVKAVPPMIRRTSATSAAEVELAAEPELTEEQLEELTQPE